MLHVNLYLAKPKSTKKTSICARFFCDSARMKYKAMLSIRLDLWDFGKQRVKASKQLPHHIELNNHLEKIRSAAFKA